MRYGKGVLASHIGRREHSIAEERQWSFPTDGHCLRF